MNIKVFPLLFIVKLKAFAFKVTHLHSVLFNKCFICHYHIYTCVKIRVKIKKASRHSLMHTCAYVCILYLNIYCMYVGFSLNTHIFK